MTHVRSHIKSMERLYTYKRVALSLEVLSDVIRVLGDGTGINLVNHRSQTDCWSDWLSNHLCVCCLSEGVHIYISYTNKDRYYLSTEESWQNWGWGIMWSLWEGKYIRKYPQYPLPLTFMILECKKKHSWQG